jgi:DNA (cytosine-5)-methyltransferase 1
MTTYYNENDPKAAAWLRQLMADGLISRGDAGYTRCHFFAGIGGWDYALQLAGWPEDLPIWTGSCPCQPFSAAGKRQGFDDPRHLWPIWGRLIRECRPVCVAGEQVATATAWLDLVSGDLEAEGYAVGSVVLGAHSVGAFHRRQRIYWVAGGLGDPDESRLPERISNRRVQCQAMGACQGKVLGGRSDREPWSDLEWLPCRDGKSRPTQPGLFPLAHGVPGRVGLLRGYGNAIVPQVAAAFLQAYLEV